MQGIEGSKETIVQAAEGCVGVNGKAQRQLSAATKMRTIGINGRTRMNLCLYWEVGWPSSAMNLPTPSL